MPDLLLELFSEEIPARMQARAADDLKKMVTDRLVDAGLVYEGARAFATPRRLALLVQGMPARQPDLKEERKGPRVGAPEGAVKGFLKAAGLASLDQATIQKDPKKGDFYVALIEKPGRPALDVLPEIVQAVVRTFPWPKSMRWGARSTESGSLAWVRPLHSIVATFGPETEQPEIVGIEIAGIKAGDTTYGHRFLAPEAIKVRHFDDYVARLEKAKVVLDPERRKQIVLADAKNLAFAQGFELVEDEGLLNEVAGLVEWPVVLMGAFDQAFLAIPEEVIRATIRANQKCFVLRDAKRGKLANRFILTANTEAADGGKTIVAGNERVIRARLSDARFFYQTDLKLRLEDRLPRFKDIVFHEKLGSQAERIERIERLAAELAPLVGADVEKARRAARLAKADLLTEVVGEFPETQGLMGKYYALAQGEDASVAAAIEEHYKPAGPNDRVPSDPVSIAVALADKIDTLVGFWAIDERPTGSKDPYALRRAALGVIRLILENNLRFNINFPIWKVGEVIAERLGDAAVGGIEAEVTPSNAQAIQEFAESIAERADAIRGARLLGLIGRLFVNQGKLQDFLTERLYYQLRDRGQRHDLISAVYSATTHLDLLLIVRRVEALGKFLDTDDGKNLLAGYKRAVNIIRIEEKKDGASYTAAPDPTLYSQAEERALADGIAAAKREASEAVAREDFAAAMLALAKLRPAVDAFFEHVTVNIDDKPLRANRLKLLNEIRSATRAVADFSRIEG